jgi:hypothetical protein
VRLDERLIFAAGSAVCVIDADGVRAAGDGGEAIVGLHVLPEAVVVVRAAGTIEQLDRATLQPLARARRGATLTCSAPITAGGLSAIAVAGEQGPIDVVTLGGELLLELHGQPGVRMLAAAGNTIAAVATDRQRIAVWSADQPDKPRRVHAITAMVQSRVTDVI